MPRIVNLLSRVQGVSATARELLLTTATSLSRTVLSVRLAFAPGPTPVVPSACQSASRGPTPHEEPSVAILGSKPGRMPRPEG
jgi:hypothetical protein